MVHITSGRKQKKLLTVALSRRELGTFTLYFLFELVLLSK